MEDEAPENKEQETQDEIIQGIPCAKFRFMSSLFGGGDCTTFHESGRLRYCKLSENLTIEGQAFRRGDEVQFDEDGELKSEKR